LKILFIFALNYFAMPFLIKKHTYIKTLFVAFTFMFSCIIPMNAQNDCISLGLMQGMNNGRVVSMAQDDWGRIWMATEGGLNCWDGYRFTVYDTDNTPLLSNELNFVMADGDSLYIGTRRDGLYILNLQTFSWTVLTRNEGLLSNAVTQMRKSDDGGIWITYYLRGVDFRGKNGKFTHFSKQTVKNLKDPNWVSANDNNDRLYIGHVMDGLSIVDTKSKKLLHNWKEIYVGTSPKTTEVAALWWDGSKYMWVGTPVGVFLYNTKSEKFEKFLPAEYHIKSIVSTSNGEKLFGGEENGKYAIMQDRSGNIWTSNFQHGVRIFSHEKPVFAATDSTENLLFNKALEFQTGSAKVGNVKYIPRPDGLWKQNPDGSIVEMENINKQLSVKYLNSVAVDKKGKLWLGSFGSGIYVFKPDGSLVKHLEFEPSPDIHMMVTDGDRIWATSRQGLIRFNNTDSPGDFRLYTRSSGLSNSFLSSVCLDKNGNVWVSGNGGISCLNIRTDSIMNFYYSDGIPFRGFVDRQCALLDDGRIIFGQDEGGCIFNPDDIEKRHAIPRFFIASLKSLKENDAASVEWNEIQPERWNDLCFPYYENSFRVSFGIEDISIAGAVEFQYMLEGVDNKWYEIDDDRVLKLYGLPPGNYELRVRARLSNGDWNESQPLSFRVSPPWWSSWWMRTVYFVLIAILIWYLWKSYQQRLKFRKLLAERLAVMHARSSETKLVSDADGVYKTDEINSHEEKAEHEKKIVEKTNEVSDYETVENEKYLKKIDKEFIDKLDQNILDNLSNPNLDIQFLTERMFTSHSTLYRKTKVITGMSVNEYIRKHRLTHAMQLLRDGYMVIDVSERCGFNSSNYFRRCFKDEYGMLPSEV